ncbi:uncharacterized protein LOC103834070 isoform X1 [Brassica rapa]|uniref:uncharacterized protein LOC103834070 isoform X1 n=1 Tax=Brassica campestris TaxID=3711 RepID=UPI00142E0F12|nr:uncharacterized protein LOC103834070 isoform X1 [Brassica rapa]XP_033133284.1 uncharacterized protein LOC103834070 isoform X1 [Brassica rapa]
MATFEPVSSSTSFHSIESRTSKVNRIPLPYLIRPRRKIPVYDSYSLYDDYIGYLSNKVGLKSDEGDVETSSLEKGNESNAMLCGTGSLSDEEYVVVDNVEVSPNSKTERAGAIQIVCSLISHNFWHVFDYIVSLLTIRVFFLSDGTLKRCIS